MPVEGLQQRAATRETSQHQKNILSGKTQESSTIVVSVQATQTWKEAYELKAKSLNLCNDEPRESITIKNIFQCRLVSMY